MTKQRYIRATDKMQAKVTDDKKSNIIHCASHVLGEFLGRCVLSWLTRSLSDLLAFWKLVSADADYLLDLFILLNLN